MKSDRPSRRSKWNWPLHSVRWSDPRDPQLLGAAQAMTDTTLHTVRDLSRLLHPAVLDDLGLPDAADAYLRDFSQRYGVKAYLRQHGMTGRLAEGSEVAAYRMIQEALTNVAGTPTPVPATSRSAAGTTACRSPSKTTVMASSSVTAPLRPADRVSG